MIKKITQKFNSLDGNIKELLSKSSQAFSLQILGKLSAYLFTVVITRNLGASVWGAFTIAFALLRLVGMVGSLGIDQAIVKFISHLHLAANWGAIKSIYKRLLLLQFLWGIVLLILIFISSDLIARDIFNNEALGHGIRIISFAIPFYILITYNAGAMRGLKYIKEYAFLREASIFPIALLISITLSLTINNKVTDYSAHYAYLLGVIITAILSVYLWDLKVKKYKTRSIKSLPVTSVLKTSLPMMLSTSMLFIMGWIDTLMLGIMDTEHSVGIYNVAVKLSQIIIIPLTAINSIIAPKISEFFYKNNHKALNKYVRSSTRLFFIASFPIFSILIILSDPFLLLFGSEFTEGKVSLYILLIGMLVNALSGANGNFLNMTGNQKYFSYILLLATTINILLNLILIPKYSIEGAAIANSTSLIVWNLLSTLFIWRKYNINTFILNFTGLNAKKN